MSKSLDFRKLKYSIFFIGLFVFQGVSSQELDSVERVKDSSAFKFTYPEYVLDDFNWRISIPIWVPGFRGSFAYGDVSIDPGYENEPPDETERGLAKSELSIQFYLMADLRFQYKRWYLEADGMRATLNNSLVFINLENVTFEGTMEAAIVRGVLGFRLYESVNQDKLFKWSVNGYAGVRYYRVSIYTNKVNLVDIEPSWTDPLIGFQIPLVYKRWVFAAQADFGGFGIDNHRSFFLGLDANYRFSKLFSLGAGWAFLDVEYDRDYKSQPLTLGIGLSGPVVRMHFTF